MDSNKVLETIKNARGLAQSSLLTAGAKDIVVDVTDLAQSAIDANLKPGKDAAMEKFTLGQITANFEDATKEEMAIHLNKVIRAFVDSVKTTIELDTSRIGTREMIEAGDDDDDALNKILTGREDEEEEMIQKLITQIKDFHNSTPEENEGNTKTPEDEANEA